MPTAAQTQRKTRAQVVAELEQACARDELSYSDADDLGPPRVTFKKTRARVLAEWIVYRNTPGARGIRITDISAVPDGADIRNTECYCKR